MAFDYYSSPFEHQSRLASLTSLRRKRKREQQEEASEENDEAALGTVTATSLDISHHGNSSLTLGPDLRPEIARQPLEFDNLPRGFPHRAIQKLPSSRPALTSTRIQDELLQLRPPLYSSELPAVEGVQPSASLKQSIIASLTTVVHRCLLQGDFFRARRAFGMLLRTEVGGQQPDLRKKNLWGIGAEILLNRNEENSIAAEMLRKDQSSNFQRYLRPWQTEEILESSFQPVRQYFDRLVLEYPSRLLSSHTLSSLHFQPLMFNLWISFVQKEHLLAPSFGVIARDENDGSESGSSEESLEILERERRLEETRVLSLKRARQILGSMDELIQINPHSEDATIWRLKGNLHLWIGDLLLPLNKSAPLDAPSLLSSAGQPTSIDPTKSKSDEMGEWYEHGQKAKDAFETARKYSRDSLGSGLESYRFRDAHA